MKILAATLFALIAAGPAAAAPSLSIFVIAGQSNAAGYGQPVPAETPNPRVVDLTHTPKVALDPVGDAPGVGPGRYLGLYLAKRGMRVGLVNCAVGGAFLQSWLPNQPPDGDNIGPCLDKVRAALPYGRLAGIVFMQGESDESRQDLASTWAARFAVFVSGIRSALATPSLPIVFGRVLDFTNCQPCGLPYGAILHQQQTAVRIPGVAMVNADDLPHEGEHFTVAGYNVLGNRMAQAWLKLRESARHS